MNFLQICILLGLVGGSYQAAYYCHNLSQFQEELLSCMNIVLAADIQDFNEAEIESFCTTIKRGAACFDGKVDGCSDAFHPAIFRQMKAETSRVVHDFDDLCEQLEELGESSFKPSVHSQRSASALNKLLSLHATK